MRQRIESWNLHHGIECGSGEAFTSIFTDTRVRGKHIMRCVECFFFRHVPGIERVKESDKRKTDQYHYGVFSEVLTNLTETKMGSGILERRCLFCESIQQDKKTKDRKEKNGGKFGKFYETQKNASDEYVSPGWFFEKMNKSVERKKHEGGNADISCDIVSMRNDIRVKDKECDSEETSECSAHFASPQEKEEC